MANPFIIKYFNKIKPPYNINTLTQKMALATLNDSSDFQSQVKALIFERQQMEKRLLSFDFVKKIYPSDANFLLVEVDDASSRYHQFLTQGIVVRNRSSQLGCNNTLRISVGTPEENITFINACKIIDQ
jgi:histidinol-phosphate aminotransferase